MKTITNKDISKRVRLRYSYKNDKDWRNIMFCDGIAYCYGEDTPNSNIKWHVQYDTKTARKAINLLRKLGFKVTFR